MEKETMDIIYKTAMSVYEGNESLSDAKKYINKEYNVNTNSFANYYRALQKMLDGGRHTRIISSGLSDYFLSKIYEVYGKDRLNRALKVYMESIKYYEESHNNCKLITERSIYDKYLKIIQ